MRKKLIKLLRKLESESGFENNYHDFFGQPECDYEVKEYLEFPNYRLVVRRYNEEYPLPKHNGLQPIILDNSIKSELKRMEMDRLILISTQTAIKYAYSNNNCGPDYDDGTSFSTESIILTTKGKSEFRYFIHKTTENPVTTVMSLLAIIISLIALFI